MAIEVSDKQISSNKITIKEVFNEDMWYSIPDYQRPYVWGEDQIISLLDDIAHAAVNTPDSQYFLGSLVLHCKDKNLNGTDYIENSVLDGQQRLTTLYILHAVIRDMTHESKRKQTCSEAIFQEGDSDDGIPERIRIDFEIRDLVQRFVDKYIKKEGGTLLVEELAQQVIENPKLKEVSILNMAKAILIIRKWFEDEENLSLDDFFPYFRQKVILIYVASSELEDAFRLFTVLNDRGIKLRNSDILKALNLKEVTTDQKRATYAKQWEELEGELGEDFDQFLSYVRTAILKDKARYNLLKEFEDNIYNPKKYNLTTKKYDKASPLLAKGDETFDMIMRYKSYYDTLFCGNNYHITNNWSFDNLISVLKDTALSDIWIPPLLVYMDKFGEDRIYDFLRCLDNKFSGDWIGGQTPSKRIEGMNAIIKQIEKVVLEDTSKTEKIDMLLSSSIFTFDTKSFYAALVEPVYGRRFVRYLLRKIDFLLDAPNYSERRNTYKEMTVEHVLPQNPEKNSQWLIDFDEERREELTHRLGNLVLISRRKNSAQGRLDFIEKKKKYLENSIETFPNSIRVISSMNWSVKELIDNHNCLINKIKQYYNI